MPAEADPADSPSSDAGDALQRRDCVSAREAMALLKVRQQTLYAYVSRGWIRSIRQPGQKQRLYLREDIERMSSRSQARAGHGAVAAAAMNHGEPIIATSITEIGPAGPRYRGRLATELARQRAPFESVAELLWSGLWHEDAPRWQVARPSASLQRLSASLRSPQAGDQLIEIFALVTLQLGLGRGSVAERVRSGRTLDAARQILCTLVGFCGLATAAGRPVPMQPGQGIAEGLLAALGVERTDENHEAVETMLTLLADHELSPGTLSARVTASSGGTLHGCIAAALCTSAGLQVARVFDRVDDFLQGAHTKPVLLDRALELQRRGAALPGFLHPLYPRGDPRATVLFDLVRRRKAQKRQLGAVLAYAEAIERDTGLPPRFELPMTALARAMGLPRQTPGALYGLARIAGWVAHVQEQRLSAQQLRPRAKFVDPAAPG